MKNVLLLLTLLVATFASATNEFTAVSGNATDPNGFTYAGGVLHIDFVPTTDTQAPSILGDTSFQKHFTLTLDTSGAFTGVSLAANDKISPPSTQWKFSICDKTGVYCFNTTQTVSGASQSLTSAFTSAAVAIYRLTSGAMNGNLYVNGTVGASGALTIATINGTNVSASGQFRGANGTVSAPSYAFTNDVDMGFYRAAQGIIGLEGSLAANGPLAVNGISTAAAPTVTPAGGTATSWGYKVVAKAGTATTIASAEGTTAAGAATLDATHTNTVTWTAINGATSYDIYRTTAGTAPATTGKIGTVLATATLSLVDNGLTDDGATAPAVDSTGLILAATGFKSGSTNPAASGMVRLSSADLIAWRNTANGADVTLGDAGAAAAGTGNIADLLAHAAGYQGGAFVDTSAAPANSGVLRVGNAVNAVVARNQAGAGDIVLLASNASNQATLPVATVASVSVASPIFQSSTANPASAGAVQLASADAIKWRNAANGGDIQLAKTGAAAGTVPADSLDLSAFGEVKTAYHKSANQTLQVITSNVTTSATTLAGAGVITGLNFTAPANVASNWSFRCDIMYSQATAAAANIWGVTTAGTAPTNLLVGAEVKTSNAGVQVDGSAVITTAASTTVATATPSAFGAIGTAADMFIARIWGTLEAPSNASPTQVGIAVATGNASDALTIYRGSACHWY